MLILVQIRFQNSYGQNAHANIFDVPVRFGQVIVAINGWQSDGLSVSMSFWFFWTTRSMDHPRLRSPISDHRSPCSELCQALVAHLWVAESPKLRRLIDNFNLRGGWNDDHLWKKSAQVQVQAAAPAPAPAPVRPSAAAVKYFVIFICKSCLTTLYEFVCSMGIFIVPLIEYANAFSHVGRHGPPVPPRPAPLRDPIGTMACKQPQKQHWTGPSGGLLMITPRDHWSLPTAVVAPNPWRW